MTEGKKAFDRASQEASEPSTREAVSHWRASKPGQGEKNIILAAGGTGGHVFPAMATADELKSRGYGVYILTDIRGEKYLKDKGYEYKVINSASPAGGYVQRMKAFAKICLGTIQSGIYIGKIRPKAVIGYGGYPSFPPLIAASINGIVTILHEQNSVLGKANRFLGKYCSKVAVSFPNTINATKVKLVGNPIRREILATPFPKLESKINILITGGSQGAKLFAGILPEVLATFSERIIITHQVRDQEVSLVNEVYMKSGSQFEVKSFFEDMPKKLAEAHLVICRGGASTIFELAKAGRPGLFIPLKTSAENHQYHNAKAVVDIGGGWLLEENNFNHEQLSAILTELINNPAKLAEAADKIQDFTHENATKNLADLVEETIK